MKMKVIFDDGSWFIGKRTFKMLLRESSGTHHFIVLDGNKQFEDLIGSEVAVPIAKPLFVIIQS